MSSNSFVARHIVHIQTSSTPVPRIVARQSVNDIEQQVRQKYPTLFELLQLLSAFSSEKTSDIPLFQPWLPALETSWQHVTLLCCSLSCSFLVVVRVEKVHGELKCWEEVRLQEDSRLLNRCFHHCSGQFFLSSHHLFGTQKMSGFTCRCPDSFTFFLIGGTGSAGMNSNLLLAVPKPQTLDTSFIRRRDLQLTPSHQGSPRRWYSSSQSSHTAS